MTSKFKVAILISGGGSTMEAVGLACQNGRLSRVAELALVIASKSSAGGIEKAKKLIDPAGERNNVLVISPKDFDKKETFGQAIINACEEQGVDLVFQCGWLPMTPSNVAEHFAERILNQHPGPLDNGRADFGDLYGMQVHTAVLYFYRDSRIERPGPPKTEVTIHLVTPDEKYDVGKLVGSHAMQIRNSDSPQTLQKRLLDIEHDLVIRTINLYASGSPIYPHTRAEPLIQPDELPILEVAKAVARRLYPRG